MCHPLKLFWLVFVNFKYLNLRPLCGQEKKALKEEKLKLEEKYMWAVVDGVKEKVTPCFVLCIMLWDLCLAVCVFCVKMSVFTC